jgi:hypothetical protein
MNFQTSSLVSRLSENQSATMALPSGVLVRRKYFFVKGMPRKLAKIRRNMQLEESSPLVAFPFSSGHFPK